MNNFNLNHHIKQIFEKIFKFKKNNSINQLIIKMASYKLTIVLTLVVMIKLWSDQYGSMSDSRQSSNTQAYAQPSSYQKPAVMRPVYHQKVYAQPEQPQQ